MSNQPHRPCKNLEQKDPKHIELTLQRSGLTFHQPQAPTQSAPLGPTLDITGMILRQQHARVVCTALAWALALTTSAANSPESCIAGAHAAFMEHAHKPEFQLPESRVPELLVLDRAIERCFGSDFVCEAGTYEWIGLNVAGVHVRYAHAALETLRAEHANRHAAGAASLPPLVAEEVQLAVVLKHANDARDVYKAFLASCAWEGSPYGGLLAAKVAELEDTILTPVRAIVEEAARQASSVAEKAVKTRSLRASAAPAPSVNVLAGNAPSSAVHAGHYLTVAHAAIDLKACPPEVQHHWKHGLTRNPHALSAKHYERNEDL